MEACGSAHYSRKFAAMGHEVRLTRAVQAPVRQDETRRCGRCPGDLGEAQRPGMKVVAVMSEAQQAVLMLHRMREPAR